jgi:pimeloyl-ACP methyl ester carboxylesterase/lysophospholipase L1-like esterase
MKIVILAAACLLTGSCMAARAAGPDALPKPLRNVHRILFLGDSITYAGGYVEEIDYALSTRYPDSRPEILDLGLPSETVSGLTEPNHAGGAFPRPWLHERLERVLTKVKPDMVVACYGMNDGIYYPFSEERFKAYQDGIRRLEARVRAAHAKFWVLTPPTFDSLPIKNSTLPAGLKEYPSGRPFEGYDGVLARYSEWLLSLRKQGWNVVDVHGTLRTILDSKRVTTPNFIIAPDGVHADRVGHHWIAWTILCDWGILDSDSNPVNPEIMKLVQERQRILKDSWLTDTGHKRPGMNHGLPLPEAQRRASELDVKIKTLARQKLASSFPGHESDYHGFTRYDFVVDTCPTIVVTPKATAPGKPWIWRAEFFDHRPETDLALLAKGFHLVYVQVGNTFGCPDAMAHWDVVYKELTQKHGFSRKPALEGLSRGGLYIYNWAAAHPKNVSVVYGDAPVCDFKSWPGGKGKGPGSPEDWAKLIKDYHFASEAEALAHKLNPIDNLKPLARAGVPLLHVYGDADEVVPYQENTSIIKERYEKLGGHIKLIVKHGVGHHPHGLDDPTPIVEYILRHTPAWKASVKGN